MNAEPLLSVIIPVHDQWPLTRQCLHGLRTATHGNFFEVLVVDNASQDATPTACPPLGRKLFGDRFAFLRRNMNQGFGPACNLAAHTARGELLFFLNNDTVPQPGWFEPLRAALTEEPDLGAVGPLLVYPVSKPSPKQSADHDTNAGVKPQTTAQCPQTQHLGIAFCLQKRPHHLYEHFPARHPLVGKKRRVSALTAAALLLPRSLFLTLDGFYPGYVNGYEDLELCARIRRQGLALRCVPESTIIHYSSQTPGRFDHDQANARLLQERCAALITPDLNRHIVQDGLKPALTPWLLPHAVQQDEDTRHLAPLTQSPLPALLDLLEAHPLWQAGYEAAGRLLQEKSDWPQALEIRLRQANLRPSLAAYTHLLRAALKCGQQSLATETQNRIAVINRLLADPHTLRRKAAHLANQARMLGEDDLERLYRQACKPCGQ
ncbi:glycosyltransferase family 2 protein [Desulfonatronum thioautotrophicum]|uniref:glycosyltransferase family 2 protein n=1 Tax=Desulfonatronum thioautotrophicum TaxID=617001 RepID=UPI0005EB3A7A|nr:glycosyltransferase family 2 protein [Desulfonatronum thioautotrophicum]